MRGRWGLQAAMTATFVAVTAAAVLLTELVIFGAAAVSPATKLTSDQVQGLAQTTVTGLAAKIGNLAGKSGRLRDTELSTTGDPVAPGQAQADRAGGLAISQNGTADCDLVPASVAVAVSRTGTVLASSYPACFPVGSQGAGVQGGVPRKVLASFVNWPVPGSGQAPLPGGKVVWATAPVRLTSPGAAGAKGAVPSPALDGGPVYAMLYVQVPATGRGAGGVTASPALARTGLVVLGGAVPVGLAFGLLSTRRLTRRLKRLAALSLSVADGDFGRRVPVTGHDEVSVLEENFNRMAGQLQASLDATRALAAANARHEERSRIARELHDSISQELFSLSVLAGGLRRSLPAGSAMLTQVETMERTAGDTMREMQSLLLALRPVALDEVGLASAIESICHAYTERLGVRVSTSVEPLVLGPTVEHAILRVTQEALANAVRHSDASEITVRLRGHGDGSDGSGGDGALPAMAELEVTDNGHGFDVAAREAGGGGLGLRAMRDRVAEHGGRISIVSSAEGGTRVRACFPPRAGR